MKNSAFVFVKPHANNEKVVAKVQELLLERNITIESTGALQGEVIDEKKLIDQHYYAIASKATLLDPKNIPVPVDKFQESFGESWENVLSENRAANAMQACERFGVDADALEKAWRKSEKVVKFGGGFYCGLVEIEGKEPLYVFNAFFMNMRSKFTGKDASINYFVVNWDPKQLSWSDFRGEVLGSTDPAKAPEGSIRKIILDEWQSLGLVAAPNQGDNGVHASASPFEGLAEKMNWVWRADEFKSDEFGQALIKNGISFDTIKEWTVDPRVGLPPAGAEQGSLFDALEDMDVDKCLEICIAINAANK